MGRHSRRRSTRDRRSTDPHRSTLLVAVQRSSHSRLDSPGAPPPRALCTRCRSKLACWPGSTAQLEESEVVADAEVAAAVAWVVPAVVSVVAVAVVAAHNSWGCRLRTTSELRHRMKGRCRHSRRARRASSTVRASAAVSGAVDAAAAVAGAAAAALAGAVAAAAASAAAADFLQCHRSSRRRRRRRLWLSVESLAGS